MSEVDHPYLLDILYGYPLKVNHFVNDPNVLSGSLRSGLDPAEDGSDPDVREVVVCIVSLARAYSNFSTTLVVYEEC